MALKLKYHNDPALRQSCEPVKADELEDLKSKMPSLVNLMKFHGGIALAANQVGIMKRFFVMSTDEGHELFINPEIIEASDLKPFEEGCLSIPGVSSRTLRYHVVVIKYFDKNFEEKIKTLEGIKAVAAQHEIDHLDGKLYIDNLPNQQKLLLMHKSKQFLNKRNRLL